MIEKLATQTQVRHRILKPLQRLVTGEPSPTEGSPVPHSFDLLQSAKRGRVVKDLPVAAYFAREAVEGALVVRAFQELEILPAMAEVAELSDAVLEFGLGMESVIAETSVQIDLRIDLSDRDGLGAAQVLIAETRHPESPETVALRIAATVLTNGARRLAYALGVKDEEPHQQYVKMLKVFNDLSIYDSENGELFETSARMADEFDELMAYTAIDLTDENGKKARIPVLSWRVGSSRRLSRLRNARWDFGRRLDAALHDFHASVYYGSRPPQSEQVSDATQEQVSDATQEQVSDAIQEQEGEAEYWT